jgi:hypothetical protein
VPDIDLAVRRQGDAHADVERLAAPVMRIGRAHHDAAGGRPPVAFLDLGKILVHERADVIGRAKAVQFQLQRAFHVCTSLSIQS